MGANLYKLNCTRYKKISWINLTQHIIMQKMIQPITYYRAFININTHKNSTEIIKYLLQAYAKSVERCTANYTSD